MKVDEYKSPSDGVRVNAHSSDVWSSRMPAVEADGNTEIQIQKDGDEGDDDGVGGFSEY